MSFSWGGCCISGMSLLTLKGSKVLQILMDLNGLCLIAAWTFESGVFPVQGVRRRERFLHSFPLPYNASGSELLFVFFQYLECPRVFCRMLQKFYRFLLLST
jgi:hypothetical protein